MITLVEFKIYMKITDSIQDTFCQSCIDYGIDRVNGKCNRDFRAGSYTLEFNGNSSKKLFLPNSPVNSITSLKILDRGTNLYTDDMFTGTDTIANSVIIGKNYIELLRTCFTSDERYQLIYNGGYVSSALWVTATAYEVGNYVINNSNKYICLTAHTSGTFATDLTAAKWQLVTADYVPDIVRGAVEEVGALFYKKSYAGTAGGKLGLSSQNMGGASDSGSSFDLEQAVQDALKSVEHLRVINI